MPLVTRLHGRRVVLSKINIGVGPIRLWAGEYRDDRDRPAQLRERRYGDFPWQRPVITDAELDHVITSLDHLGKTWAFRS